MFDFVIDSFDLEKTNEYILSIQINLDGFSFSIYSPVENKIVGSKVVPLKISNDNLIVHHFEDWVEKEEILQKNFSKIYIVYFSAEFSLIPDFLYSSQLVKAATNRLIDENGQKHAEEVTINNIGTSAKIVFYLPKNLKEIVGQKFPDAVLINPAQLLIEKVTTKENKKNSIAILYCRKSFIMLASKGNQILLANGFTIEHINDLIYFLLNATTQLNLNLKETSLQILEALTKYDGLEELLQPYFSDISYISPTSSIDNSEMIPSGIHRYFAFK